WKIEAKKLYLVKIDRLTSKFLESGVSDKESAFPLEQLFSGKKSPIFASWYSGMLRIPEGELKQYVHAGFASIYEKERYLFVSRGNIVREVLVELADNQRGIADFDNAVSFLKKQEAPDTALLKDAEFYRKRLMEYAKKFGDKDKGIHVVQAGESLTGIARKYQMRISALEAMNPGVDGRKLRIGQKLNVAKLPDMDEAKVLEIAKKVMTEKGSNLEDLKFSTPRQQADNSWHVFYERIPATPGAHGVIQIDEKGNFTGIIPGA
ncbi:MAG: LysM peptidoglycan-binding domain-containing protein, partial [Puniceicoccales bacterium]|nr:LysM peptidoglycan-binding domain-containing protein [Puniceicoccales bacterium]